MSNTATARDYIGIFLVSAGTLMFELILTRIFSVTMWYHFAFMAISIAMFGMTVGALFVFLRPDRFRDAQLRQHMGVSALASGFLMVTAMFVHIHAPQTAEPEWIQLATTFLWVSAPVVASGICICLALTRFPSQVSRLYAFDLGGAAVGCVAIFLVLGILDGGFSVIAAAFIVCAGGVMFLTGENRLLRWSAFASALLWGALCVYGGFCVKNQSSPLKIERAKGRYQLNAIYERWNSFSRIVVFPPNDNDPVAWSLSSAYNKPVDIEHQWLLIDASAGTPLLKFEGDFRTVDYLRYDVTNFGHHMRTAAEVLIVGAGGGRDILTALAMGQKRIVAVEINRNILDVVTDSFADYTGYFYRDPRVELVHDEARSYAARQQQRFDLIQLSFIDTFAATAAGAFVLSENSLYTVEGWMVFLEHLRDGGILSVSRGFLEDELAEIYRLCSLARVSLERLGVENPERHIIVVANLHYQRPPSWGQMATLLVSPRPFSDEDIALAQQIAEQQGFDFFKRPGYAVDQNFAALASGEGLEELERRIPLDLSAPTDDNPFFFNMLRLGDALFAPLGENNPNLNAVSLLVKLLGIVVGLTVVCIILPVRWSAIGSKVSTPWPLSLFFSSIGLGFMLVEVSLMQHLIIFLGHPTYGLIVVLSVLLMSGGIGSRTTVALTSSNKLVSRGVRRLALLLAALLAVGLLLHPVIRAFAAASTPVRIAAAVVLVAPLGVCMGMAFPMGMGLTARRTASFAPWLWGLNGATSVCGAVLAVAIAMTLGISAGYWCGAACYLIALMSFAVAGQSPTAHSAAH